MNGQSQPGQKHNKSPLSKARLTNFNCILTGFCEIFTFERIVAWDIHSDPARHAPPFPKNMPGPAHTFANRFAIVAGAFLAAAALMPGALRGQSSAGFYETNEPPVSRSTAAAAGLPPPLTARTTPENRAEPTRATQHAAFAGAGARADQVAAIREAYGVSTGPVTYNLGAGLDLEFNDNVFQTKDSQESDLVLRPQANLTAFWGITDLNTLSFNLTAGYGYYLNNNDLSDFFLNTGFAPGSQIDLQIFAGDFVITIYDKLAYNSSPLQIVQSGEGGKGQRVVTTSDYGRLLNTIGLDVLWDLNDLVLVAGCSRFNYWSLGDSVQTQDRVTDQISAAARFSFSPALAAGAEGSMSWTSYSEDFQNDSAGYSIGPFIEWQPTDRTRLRLMGGLQSSDFDEGGLNGDQEDLSSWYGAVQASQRLTDWFSHTLEIGREAGLGTNTNFSSVRYIRHRGVWDVIRNWDLTTELSYEKSEDSPGLFAADTNTLVGAVSLGRMIANKLKMVISYQHTSADSTDDLQTYEQNLLRLSLYYNY